jgi:hypothetical protein
MKHKKQLRKMSEDAKHTSGERTSSGEYSDERQCPLIHTSD